MSVVLNLLSRCWLRLYVRNQMWMMMWIVSIFLFDMFVGKAFF